MHLDGSFLLSAGSPNGIDDIRLEHRLAATILTGLGPTDRRPFNMGRGRGTMIIPYARILHRLDEIGGDLKRNDLRDKLAEGHRKAISDAASTSVNISCGDLAVDHDTGVPHATGSGPDSVTDATDDPVLKRLMEMHAVRRIARLQPGVEGFWGDLVEKQGSFGDPNPHVRYHGLPEAFPSFMIRPPRQAGRHGSCVAVSFGRRDADNALYVNDGGSAWVGVNRELPMTLAMVLVGRPATDLVGHEALEGLTIGDPFDGGDDAGASAFNLVPA